MTNWQGLAEKLDRAETAAREKRKELESAEELAKAIRGQLADALGKKAKDSPPTVAPAPKPAKARRPPGRPPAGMSGVSGQARVLSALSGAPLSVREISLRAKVPRATTHAHLCAMMPTGAVVRLSPGVYTAGSKVEPTLTNGAAEDESVAPRDVVVLAEVR